MKYFWSINYIKSMEYWLNITQWLLMEIFLKLNTWANSIILDGEVFYSLAGSKIVEEVPLLFKTKRTAIDNITVLVEKWLIIRRIEKNKSYYKITEKWKEFDGVQKSEDKCAENCIPGVQKSANYNNIIYNNINIKDIIDFLNSKTKKNYKASTWKTLKLIQARIKEWFNLDDFKKVIEVKSKQWYNTEYEKYLRPETLFWTKFEWYLQEYKDKKHIPEIDINKLVF